MRTYSDKLVIFSRGSALVAWMAAIFFFSSLPGSGVAYDPPLWYMFERKGAHVFEFAILMILAFRFFRSLFGSHESWRRVAVLALAFAFMYGALDEVHQAFVFGRGSRLSDVGFDVLGAVLAFVMIRSIFSVPSLKEFKRMV
ncbi:MAG: hypothetical protein QG664_908 [Patescibacteria group bacterium]|nr:hypothetical protein [Patescibacteria group bacterium]